MPPFVALILFSVGIVGLFFLDRDPTAKTSKALWIPVAWLWILSSREVSLWLAAFGMGEASVGDLSLDGNPVDRKVYTVLLLMGLVVLAMRGSRVKNLLATNGPILWFFAYCAVSACWSDYPGVALKRWIKALSDVVMVIIIVTEFDPLAAIKKVLSRVSFVLIPASVLLIKYYPSLGKGFKHYGLSIYYGVTTNKNLLGIICLLFGLASVWRFLSAYAEGRNPARRRQLIAHGTIIILVMWLFSMARSMTGLACFLMVAPLIWFSRSDVVKRRPAVLHWVILSVLALSFSVLFLGLGGASLVAMGKDPTLTGRTEIWRLVLSVNTNPLFGSGFESFWLPGWRRDTIWRAFWWHPNEAHNGYIEVCLNLGWIGLSILAVIIIAGYRRIVAALKTNAEVARLSLAYFVVALIYNFTEAGFRMLDPVWIMFLLSIMASSKNFSKASTMLKQDVDRSTRLSEFYEDPTVTVTPSRSSAHYQNRARDGSSMAEQIERSF